MVERISADAARFLLWAELILPAASEPVRAVHASVVCVATEAVDCVALAWLGRCRSACVSGRFQRTAGCTGSQSLLVFYVGCCVRAQAMVTSTTQARTSLVCSCYQFATVFASIPCRTAVVPARIHIRR